MFIALTIAIGLTPAVVSLFVCLYSRRRLQQNFQQNIYWATDYTAQESFRQFSTRPRHPDAHYVEGMGLVIGDITCQLNARSPFLRCAPNPSGPCEGCREYEGKEYT